MKTILKKAAATIVLLSSILSMANAAESPFWKKNKTKSEVEKNIITLDAEPTFKRKGNKLFMNLLNLDKEKITIKVYDSEGRIVFKEVIEGDMVITKAFNFEKAFEDKYTVVVSDGKEIFKESVLIK